jgi:hypothetical protein
MRLQPEVVALAPVATDPIERSAEMDLENIERVGRAHGRDLAKRVVDRAKREGLTASEMAGLFAEDIVRQSRALQMGDVNDDHIGNWVAAVAQGYSERMDEETRKLR